eukprot:COSAG04_NODE_3033_length_3254_cov_6.097623_2_plen_223_part_00
MCTEASYRSTAQRSGPASPEGTITPHRLPLSHTVRLRITRRQKARERARQAAARDHCELHRRLTCRRRGRAPCPARTRQPLSTPTRSSAGRPPHHHVAILEPPRLPRPLAGAVVVVELASGMVHHPALRGLVCRHTAGRIEARPRHAHHGAAQLPDLEVGAVHPRRHLMPAAAHRALPAAAAHRDGGCGDGTRAQCQCGQITQTERWCPHRPRSARCAARAP